MRRVLPAFAILALGACRPPGVVTPPAPDPALEFARSALTRLCAGDADVVDAIDWTQLRGESVDVGARYRALPDDSQRAAFRRSFVATFSASMRGVAATGWHVAARTGARTDVAADLAGATLHLVVDATTGLHLVAITRASPR